MRRARPSVPSTRAGNALAKVPAQSWQGRLPVLTPQVQAGTNPAQFENIAAAGLVQVQHVTAYLQVTQELADGGGSMVYDRVGTVPTPRVGFGRFAANLATAGQVDVIDVEVTGYAIINYRRRWADLRQSGTLEVVITRGGSEQVHPVPFGAPPARLFAETLPRFWVEAGDTIALREPNTSGAAQQLDATSPDEQVVDVSVWAFAAATSDSVPSGDLELVGFEEGEGVTDAIAGTSEGDLLLAMVVSHNNSAGGTVSTPSGWTFIARHSNPGSIDPPIDTQPVDLFYRVATASEPSTYGTWTNDGDGAGAIWVGIANVGPGDPAALDIEADVTNGGSASSLSLPVLTGALWLYVLNVKGDAGITDILDDATVLAADLGGAQLNGYWWQGHSGVARSKDVGTHTAVFVGIGVRT